MGYRLNIYFDYLCLFAPIGDADVVVVLPDLRTAPLSSLNVGAHHPAVRWEKRHHDVNAPVPPTIDRPVDQSSNPTANPFLRVSFLDGEDLEVRIGGQPLTGAIPRLSHLTSLTSLTEGQFLNPAYNFLHSGFLLDPPTPKNGLPQGESINIVARIRLRGGSFHVDAPDGLSIHDFQLIDETGNPLGNPKRIARQVRWQSEDIPFETPSDVHFRKFGAASSSHRLRLRPENSSDPTVRLSIRNSDSIADFLLPGLPPYDPKLDNFEPRVYQTLSAGYQGFAQVKKLIHRPIPNSANGVCGPAQASGVR